MTGEWEKTPQELEDEKAKRGLGRCFWWGCIGPGWKPNPSMLNSPSLQSPFYNLCSRHYEEAVSLIAATADVEERLHAPRGVFEVVTKKRSRLSEVIRDKKIREAQSLQERDGARREWASKLS